MTWLASALTDGCVSVAVSLFQHKEKALCGNYSGPWGIELYFLWVEFFHGPACRLACS
jgi:hypothetical protein